MKGLANNLFDMWNMTREKSTRTLLEEILRHGVPDEKQRQCVMKFIHRIAIEPDMSDDNYRHTILCMRVTPEKSWALI